jgi:hypothetical protein
MIISRSALVRFAGLLHHRIVVSEEGAELVGPVREHKKNVRNEARLFLHRNDTIADVFRHVLEIGNGETAYGACVGYSHNP